MENTNIAFFGEDHNSQIILKKLIRYCKNSSKYTLSLIITTRPKPKGRKRIEESNPIEKIANRHNINIHYYSPKHDEMSKLIDTINSRKIKLAILTSFGHILPPILLRAFSRGIINLHPSLLPQYRGATPVQHALALGDTTTGVTLFTLDKDIDKGTILAQKDHKISENDTYTSLSRKLFDLGASLLEQVLDNTVMPLKLNKYPHQNIVFTKTLKRKDGYIKWTTLLALLNNENTIFTKNQFLNLYLVRNSTYSGALRSLIQALNPWPGVWTDADTKKGLIRIKLTQIDPQLMVHLANKPKPITWSEFSNNYL